MLKKSLNITSTLLIGFTLIFVGYLFIHDYLFAISKTYQLYVIVLVLLTIASIIYVILTKWTQKKLHLIVQVTFLCIVGIVGYNNSDMFFQVLPTMIGVWMLIQAVVKAISIQLMLKDQLPNIKRQVFFFIVDTIFGCTLFLDPLGHTRELAYLIGGYLIFYGLTFIYRCFTPFIPAQIVETIDEKFQLAIPPMWGAVIPPHLMKVILSKSEQDQRSDDFDAIKYHIHCDLEVLVHVAKSGPAQLGHCDLVYHDHLLSYGCYDPSQRKLFGTYGDGVVILAPKDEYLYNCLEHENKVLVAFGIVLNEKQKEKLQFALLETFKKFEHFSSDEDLKRMGKEPLGPCDDYLSRVTRNVEHAQYYKITEGKYKTFFVFYSNCVSYVSQFLNEIGLHLLDFSGIISPGAYFDFLNNEFKSGKGHVVYRKIYTKKDAPKFKKSTDK